VDEIFDAQKAGRLRAFGALGVYALLAWLRVFCALQETWVEGERDVPSRRTLLVWIEHGGALPSLQPLFFAGDDTAEMFSEFDRIREMQQNLASQFLEFERDLKSQGYACSSRLERPHRKGKSVLKDIGCYLKNIVCSLTPFCFMP
jgi:hypothetical protein